MKILSSSKPSHEGGAWLLGLLLVALSWLLPTAAHATHLRAGDIQAKVDTTPTHNPNRIFFKLTLYRDPNMQADTPSATMYFGDGTSATSPRAANVRLTPIVTICTYYFDHTYPGSNTWTASVFESNRVGTIVNIPNSVNQTFALKTTFQIRPSIGLNHSPILKAPAIDQAASGKPYVHNPAAYDADGDSLGFRLIESQQVITTAQPPANFIPNLIPCTGFTYANNPAFGIPGVVGLSPPLTVPFNGALSGNPSTLDIDRNGLITWNVPARLGEYNIAFIVEEWRRTIVDGRMYHTKIGEVMRDMQVTVVATNNLPPTITIPQDTCVVAGTFIGKNITAVDNTSPTSAPATPVQLFAYGGMLPPNATLPAATFTQSTQGPPRAVARFQWTPDCSNIAKDPYLVVFKAQDTPHVPPIASDPPLVDTKTWRVTVIGPAPTGLQATPTSSATGPRVLLNWSAYPCAAPVAGVVPNMLIFRRENCYAYTPSACETGLPASAGYTQIGSVPANLTTYADDNVQRGRTYSYRIYVSFPLPALGASIVSNEACLTLNGRSSQITNVDVLSTGTSNGQISIKWTRPQPTTGSVFNAPLGYRLSRSLTGAAPFTLVATKTSISDTTFVDTNLNTQALQYTYQLVFFNAATTQPGSTELTETSPLASSVRLAVVPNGLGRTNALTWSYQVPWDNSKRPTVIYRRTGTGTTGTYTQIATLTPGATSGTYTDSDPTLQFNQTYCYYVQTVGQYATPVNSAGQLIYDNLLNKSQEQCARLSPTPCTPVLTLAPTNCDSLSRLDLGSGVNLQDIRYQNRLRWTIGNTPAGCSTDAVYFRIFYRSTANGPLVLLDSTRQYTYVHRNLTNGAGCYAVQAVNPDGIRSEVSNVACQDECVFFILPNIFTPNGDDFNEKFRPKTASPIVRTHIQIFNRWGRKVYESDKDPYINWDGGGAMTEVGSNGKAAGGVYYYLAEVEFADFANTKRTFKGWVELVR